MRLNKAHFFQYWKKPFVTRFPVCLTRLARQTKGFISLFGLSHGSNSETKENSLINWVSFLFIQVLTYDTNPWNGVCMWYFYILQSISKPDYFYKGTTNNLQRRLEQHNTGEVFSSSPYKPYRLVYYEAYLYEFAARIRESAVKKSGSISVPLIRRIKESLNLSR